MKDIDYDKLRLDVLETMVEQRDIKCRRTKHEMIKYLKLDDDDKYIRETVFEKYGKDEYIIGIDINNNQDLTTISRMVEKNEVKRIGLYQNNRIYFISNKKIEL